MKWNRIVIQNTNNDRLPGEFELCFFGALASEGGDDFAVDIEHLNAMIVRIGDDDAIGRTHSDVVRVFQLSGPIAQTAELAHERPVRLEHLNTMVLLIAHVDEAQRVRRHAPRIAELAVGRALRAEDAQEAAGRIEHLDAVVVAIGDDELADAVGGHAR